MHGMSGYDVCALLKAHDATHHVPVVIVTAHDKDEDYSKAVEVGADDFLPKPFNSVLMLARIRSLLRIKQLYDLLAQRDQRLRAILDQYVAPETAGRILADLGE
jgi:two-component system cell cycle response regulator